MRDIEEKLSEFGLSEKEAKVYLALLELGTSLVTDVAKKSGINRSTSYVVLESLAKQGLVSITQRKTIRLYTPTSPERLVQNLEERSRHLVQLVGLAKSILPELKSVFVGSGTKPRVQFFEGIEGIKTAYEDTLDSPETIRAYASIESMHETLPGYFPEYYKRRSEKGIHIRAIFPDTPESRERIRKNKEEKREARLVPTDMYSFTPEIMIYDKKTTILSLKEKFALTIESEEIADTMKKVWELAWLGAEKYDKKAK